MNKYTIVWPDGKVQSADSFDALYNIIKSEQHGIINDTHFRLVMRRRAKVWRRRSLPLFSSKARFVEAMARADMFTLVIR